MNIALGADHAGFALKSRIADYLQERGIVVTDVGTHGINSVDYPDFAKQVADRVASRQSDFGILVCGSGIGMAIAANKVRGIRAANVASVYEAQMSREHNDLNVLTLGARILSESDALAIVDKWLSTAFAHGRHTRRVEKISDLEQKQLASGQASS